MSTTKKNLNADLINKSDAELVSIWRVEKKTLLEDLLPNLKEEVKSCPTKSGRKRLRKRLKQLKLRIEILKGAASRHMAQIGKKGSEKMARRARQKKRREKKVRAKSEHEAKIAERKARRAKEKAERKARDERRKAEMEADRKQRDSKRLNRVVNKLSLMRASA